MPLKLRPARAEDADALTSIMHAAKASWGYPKEKMAAWRDHWQITKEKIADNPFLVLEKAGRPIGFSGLSGQSLNKLSLDYLYIAPEFHGQNHGKLLLQRTEDQARKLKASRLTLRSEVNAGGFYEKAGYQTVSEEPSTMAPGRFMPIMEKDISSTIVRLRGLDLKHTPKPWDFEARNPDAVEKHFAEKQKELPELWNGRTLKLTDHSLAAGVLSGICTECSYAAFLTWRDWGAPDLSTLHLFGAATVKSSDGALLFGVMAEHTATAGLIYPPGGNLDLQDIKQDGTVDIEGAILRELEEETGLSPSDLEAQDLLLVIDGARVCVTRVFQSTRTAKDLREAALAHSLASQEKELSDIRMVRSETDLKDPAIIPYARDLARYLLNLNHKSEAP